MKSSASKSIREQTSKALKDRGHPYHAALREAGPITVLTSAADGSHLSQRETAIVLERTGLSPLGPLACNTAAPDEGTPENDPRAGLWAV